MQRWILAAIVVLVGALVGLVTLLGNQDRQPSEAAVTPAPEEPREVVVEEPLLELHAPTAVLRARVTSEANGRPLAGVRVSARRDGKPTIARLVPLTRDSRGRAHHTGLDGMVELGLDPDVAFKIFASLDDRREDRLEDRLDAFQSVSLEPPLAADEVRTISIALPGATRKRSTQPDVRLHARVVDRDTGAPIGGARFGRSVGWRTIAPEDERRTDDDGRFVVETASSERRYFHVIAAGYGPACVAPVTGHATPERALEIALSRAASARITVVGMDGAPIAGLDASLETSMFRFGHPDGGALISAGGISPARYCARTDERGVAAFTDLPPRVPLTGLLERGHRGLFWAPEDLMFAPGESREVTWRVGAGCVIRGIALESDGRPAATLAIALEPALFAKPIYFHETGRDKRHALTDRDGRFSFKDVAPGDWWIGPAPEDGDRPAAARTRDAAPSARVIHVARDARRVDVEIRVKRGLAISGRVLDPSGAPVDNASIDFTRMSDQMRGDGWTRFDPSGRFLLQPIEDGEHELVADAQDFLASEPVIARAGDTNVELRLRAGGSIDGQVVEMATGTPCAARLIVTRADVDRFVAIPRTDKEGRFHLGGLSPGVYGIAANTSNGLVGIASGVEVAGGAKQTVRLQVEPGARVRVRGDGGSWPHGELTVLAGDKLVAMGGLEPGAETTLTVPVGAIVLHIRIHRESKDFDLPLELRAGETHDVVFDGAWK